ncbi:MAG: hypothetical protein IJY28_07090 [Clostridia bacterium]|nr:hypothetical protein [Clostridia bacterium]
MRNLTILRTKSFVGCAMKLNVYIVDECGDTTINNQLCRKLGTLKNGQEQTFQIDDWATRIYVIADKLSKGFCSEMYDLPAGVEDVRLTGKCKYSLISGNAFRFDGPVSADAQAYRKKTGKKGWIVMIVAVILGVALGVLSGWLESRTEPKTFAVDGMVITLHTGFEEYEDADLDACYLSEDVEVMITGEKIADLKALGLEVNSLKDYGELLIDLYDIDAELVTEDGLTYFEYDYGDPVIGDYHYVCTLHESADAYWIVEFATYQDEAAEHAEDIRTWAKSVAFAEGAAGAV